MSVGRMGARLAFAVVGVLVAMAFGAVLASASGLKTCVPKKEGSAFLTPKHGKCNKGYKLTLLGAEGQTGALGKAGAEGKPGAEGKAGHEGKTGPEGNLGLTSGELETLRSVLPHMSYAASGIGGKPTIRFSAVNVQIVNGVGKTINHQR